MKLYKPNNYSIKIIFLFLLPAILKLTLFVRSVSAQIVPDYSLGSDSSNVIPTVINGIPSVLVNDGAIRGSNLFHSFQNFSVVEGSGVYFKNPEGIQNIIGRVTGNDPSKILGTLGVLGNANLFLINPYGIIFGSNSSLDLKGSFIATTANAIQFENQGLFDTSSNGTLSLLTVNPSGLLFLRENPASITNYANSPSGTRANPDRNSPNSIINLNGLRVADGRSLLMIGGDFIMDGGGLYALGGEIGVGSVMGMGLARLLYNGDNISFSIPSNIARGNILLTSGSRIDTSGNNTGGGQIQIIGQNIRILQKSQVISTINAEAHGGGIFIDAKNSVELVGLPVGGTISTLTSGSGHAGNIIINSDNFSLKEGAVIQSSTLGDGNGGDINIFALKSIDLAGILSQGRQFGGIFSTTFSAGNGGNINIETQGNLIINSRASITSGAGFSLGKPAPGRSGDIKIVANKSVNINDSFLLAVHPIGDAGNISITTSQLNINNSTVAVFSVQGKSGNLAVTADSLRLDRGILSADTGESGANIFLTIFDTLRLENESTITATANGSADGGNIKIDTPILLAFSPTDSEGSDIKANAISGSGGNITINAQGVFGIQKRKATDSNQTNDIDASSQFGQSGQVQINTTTDPTQGLVELPETVIDPSTLVAQNPCKQASSSEFTRSGRGGLPPSLSQDLNGESIQVGLVEPVNISAEKPEPKSDSKQASSIAQSSSQIAPAQGWVYNNKGEVVLVAYNSAVTNSQRIQTTPAGCPVF